MTAPESPHPTPDSETNVATAATAPETAPEPAPVPWTPERVTEWNAYYDLYVALGLLLLVFVVSANKITTSALWPELRAGQLIAARGAPLTADPFSYTEEGRRWVNIPWLFEWSHYSLYKLGYGLIYDKNDPGASGPRAEQLGAGILVGLDALVRVLTALTLLRIRRSGPGLWWSVVCVTLALGAVFSPMGIALGGISGPGQVSPVTWGLLLLALELLLIHRLFQPGPRRRTFVLLPVLFMVWANIDESFLIGLLLLGAAVVGLIARRPAREAPSPSLPSGLALLAACAAACLVNPSFHAIFPAALAPLSSPGGASGVRTLDQASFFGKELRQSMRGGNLWALLVLYYLSAVGIGLGSFALNRERFSLSRFLMFAAIAALWGCFIRHGAEFAVVFAVTLALNGQEWYQARFGTRGRLGRSWALWSVGGRAGTIVVLFFFIAKGLTGYGGTVGEVQFGFGYNPDNFEFEAADYLKNAKIKGNVLNTSRQQGDALIWRAYPQRQVFIDDRRNLYPPSVVAEWQAIRKALAIDAVEEWKPFLNRFKISVVMIDEAGSPKTYQQLMTSPNWIPFYDDGNVVMFGRADAAPEDVAVFKSQRLDAETLAYRRNKPVPPMDRPPTQVDWLDEIFQSRSLTRPQPHDDAANRWIKGLKSDAATAPMPDPARCLLAIQEARISLSRKPDDYVAYRILNECYRALMIEEMALLQGTKLTPENLAQLARVGPPPTLLVNRYRQRITALNYAIQTTPPPRILSEWKHLHSLNFELFQLFAGANQIDLARDRLRAIVSLNDKIDLPADSRSAFVKQLNQLDEAVKAVEDRMNAQSAEQGGPVQRAMVALAGGAPGLAIQEFEEANRSSISPAVVKPRLIDLYCETGQPDKALEVLNSGDPDDPALGGGEPGAAALRQSRVYLLLGNYVHAADLLRSRAIPPLRYDRSRQALTEAQFFAVGQPEMATRILLTLPNKLATQANWEYELGMYLLEGGMPLSGEAEQEAEGGTSLSETGRKTGAADHFTKTLTMVPDFTMRPIIAYYLEKMGRPVPPLKPEKKPGGVKKPSEEPGKP